MPFLVGGGERHRALQRVDDRADRELLALASIAEAVRPGSLTFTVPLFGVPLTDLLSTGAGSFATIVHVAAAVTVTAPSGLQPPPSVNGVAAQRVDRHLVRAGGEHVRRARRSGRRAAGHVGPARADVDAEVGGRGRPALVVDDASRR